MWTSTWLYATSTLADMMWLPNWTRWDQELSHQIWRTGATKLSPIGSQGCKRWWMHLNLEMSTVGMGEGSDSWKNLVLLGNIFGPNRAVGMGRIKTYDTMFSGISQGLARLEAQLWSWVDPLSQRFTTRLNLITDLLEHGARNHHAWRWAKDRPRTALPKKNAKQ